MYVFAVIRWVVFLFDYLPTGDASLITQDMLEELAPSKVTSFLYDLSEKFNSVCLGPLLLFLP